MRTILFCIFLFSFLIINAQQLTDEQLTDKQHEFLEVLNILRPKIEYDTKEVAGFYEFYEGEKNIEIPGHRIDNKYIEDISLWYIGVNNPFNHT